MEINVSEVIESTPMVKAEERMFKSRRPISEEAWRRAVELNNILCRLQTIVNDTLIGDTEESWKIAYEMLYTAFKNAIAEEKQIAMKL